VWSDIGLALGESWSVMWGLTGEMSRDSVTNIAIVKRSASNNGT